MRDRGNGYGERVLRKGEQAILGRCLRYRWTPIESSGGTVDMHEKKAKLSRPPLLASISIDTLLLGSGEPRERIGFVDSVREHPTCVEGKAARWACEQLWEGKKDHWWGPDRGVLLLSAHLRV